MASTTKIEGPIDRSARVFGAFVKAARGNVLPTAIISSKGSFWQKPQQSSTALEQKPLPDTAPTALSPSNGL